jgi:hypothetical protein
VVAVTVVTANHLLLDAVAAACVVGCAYGLAAKPDRVALFDIRRTSCTMPVEQ